MADALTKYNACPAVDTEVTVATIAASKAFIVKEVIISNTNAADKTAILKFDDTLIVPTTTVPARNAIRLSGMNTHLDAADTIKFTGNSANEISYYISGVTIDV